MNRLLPYDLTPEQMARGYGMVFHPCECPYWEKAHSLETGYLFYFEAGLYYLFGVPSNPCSRDRAVPLPPIGDGKPHVAGEPYLRHWVFCPFTGKRLDDPKESWEEKQIREEAEWYSQKT